MTVDKAEILRGLDDAWSDIKSLVDSIPEPEKLQCGVVEEWSVKDLLGHMAFWANKASDDLKVLSSGMERAIETPGGEEAVAEWNARETAARKDRPLADLEQEWLQSFASARTAFEVAPPEKLEMEVQGWPQLSRFLEDTTIHYREHEHHIRAWLKQLETTEE